MQVLLLDDDFARHEDIMTTFMVAGCEIQSTASSKVAEMILKRNPVELLIAAENIRGRLTHCTALYAEHRNPLVSTVMISDRVGEDVEELYMLIPSVHTIVGSTTPARLLLALGKASVASKRPRRPVAKPLPRPKAAMAPAGRMTRAA
jgi:hypothetical protein